MPVTIQVNGAIAASDIDIAWTNETMHTYPVGSCLKAGSNTITFTLAANARTRYDIKRISLLKQ